jgi:hypothetical protein
MVHIISYLQDSFLFLLNVNTLKTIQKRKMLRIPGHPQPEICEPEGFFCLNDEINGEQETTP